jgi:hypothetical protein
MTEAQEVGIMTQILTKEEAKTLEVMSERLRAIFERDGRGDRFDGMWNYLCRSVLEAANLEIVCTWEEEVLDGYWATSCKNAWSFTDGDTPSGHKMAVCAFCGGRIIEKWSEERAWDSMSTFSERGQANGDTSPRYSCAR